MVHVFMNKSEIAKALFDYIKEDDVILIKGSRGMAMETIWLELNQLGMNSF